MNPPLDVLESLPTLCQNLVTGGLGIVLQTTLLLFIGLVLGRVLARRGPMYRSSVYRATLLSVIASLPLFLCLNPLLPASWRLALPAAESSTISSRDIATASPAIDLPTTPALSTVKPSSSTPARITVASPTITALNQPPPASPLSTPFTDYLKPNHDSAATGWGWLYVGIVAVYLCGLVGHLTWLLICWNGVQRLVRESRPVTKSPTHDLLSDVCAAERISVPCLRANVASPGVYLVGTRQPTILLPDGWADVQETELIRAVLTHEVAHLAARDPLWNLVFRQFCALLWVQPLLWLVAAYWEAAREEVCDLAVVRQGITPRFYARCLLRLAEEFASTAKPMVATSAAVRGSALGKRIENLMRCPPNAMHTLSRRVQATIALIACCLTGTAAVFGAITAPGQQPKPVPDARLQQRVTISAEGISLEEFLPQLSEKTGVKLLSSRSTADDKVVLFCKSRPLREVMDDLATLYNYEWRPQSAGSKPDYVLIVTNSARRYEDKLAGARRQRFLKHLDAQISALSETPDTLNKRPEKDPIRQALSSPQGRTATTLYSMLSSQQREDLYDRWSVSLPVRSLSTAQKTDVSELFYGERFKPDPVSGLTPTEIPTGEMDDHALNFNLMVIQSGNSGSLLVMMNAPTGFGFSLATLPAESAFTLPPNGNPYTGEAVPETATLQDPKIVTAITDSSWIDRLRQLAEKTGLPVVADYYRSPAIHTAPEVPTGSGDMHIARDILDAFSRPTGYLWWTRGSALLFRKRDWYEQRLYEVPDRWTLTLVKQLEVQKGTLAMGNILRLRELTLSQLVGMNQSLGGKHDRRLLAGFQELLHLVSVSSLGTGRILTDSEQISPGSEVMREAAFRPNVADPSQRELLGRFLANFLMNSVSKNQNWDDFGFVFQRMPQESLTRFSIKNGIGFNIYLHLGNALGVGYFGMALPASLPDDRRDRTKIEALPSN